ncbi:Sas10/Utp3 family protein-like protein [Lojkania enalia]|uniref:Sas10/Utp3 family protein-like protein n=1 Tax=Lojkania enalia TaxID=147567 RepID=A0A9P4N5Y9_9PLEO|nr:Sas10/Utp3 family protein-like protein [Didymosphaeria enalia]
MGRKRKAGGQPYGEPKPEKDTNFKMRITTFEDVADSEDEFHLNQDKILLDEGPAAKRLRKWKEQDAFLEPSDEEVLDYSDDKDEDDEDIDGEIEDYDARSDDDLGASKRQQQVGDEDGDFGGWGLSKDDYYNADVIETEQDALDEETEARRLQKKQLEGMTEADFGIDEDDWLEQADAKAEDVGKVVTEVLPPLQITEDMSEHERVKILRARYPEFEHISREYLRLQPLHNELASAANAAERLIKSRAAKSGKLNGIVTHTPIAITKYRACAAYLAAMAMYFAILGSTANSDGSPTIAMDPTELHEHAVMESLLKCQKLWGSVEGLPVADPMVEASNGDELSVIEEVSPGPEAKMDDAIARKKKDKKQKKTKTQLAAEAAQAEAQARRAAKLLKTEEDLATLSALTDKAALRKASKHKKAQQQPMLNLVNADDSDFGEETSLTAHELAEKAKKKKSLRFYTSQIAQKANKREAAGRDYGGDIDVPHRERLKDRQARLQAEAEKRGQNKNKGPGVALGEGGESSDENEAPRGNASDDEDYYGMVSARSKAKKQAKRDLAATYALAAKEGGAVVPEETIGPDGRREITYAIKKNKGLTPFRKKEVRNPRVKKKLRYEAKQKKLKSQKAVYSGGEGRGGYGGELTGIKKGLVRSTKL